MSLDGKMGGHFIKENRMKKIFESTYNWEELYDLERDVSEAIEWNDELAGEFPGTIKVTIEYDPNDE